MKSQCAKDWRQPGHWLGLGAGQLPPESLESLESLVLSCAEAMLKGPSFSRVVAAARTDSEALQVQGTVTCVTRAPFEEKSLQKEEKSIEKGLEG